MYGVTRMLVAGVVAVGLGGAAHATEGGAARTEGRARAAVAEAGHWLRDRRVVPPWLSLRPPASRPDHVWQRPRLAHGALVRGAWVPAGPAPAAGMAWVPGHWEGRTWVDGRWRAEARPGWHWVAGHRDGDGHWVDGRWRADQRIVEVHAPAPVAVGSSETPAVAAAQWPSP